MLSSTPHSCQVNWTGIAREFVNGELVAYEVRAVKNASANQTLVDKLDIVALVCSSRFHLNVTLLHVFTTYNIKVAVHNNIGRGHFSEAVECITGETGKGGAVIFICLFVCLFIYSFI